MTVTRPRPARFRTAATLTALVGSLSMTIAATPPSAAAIAPSAARVAAAAPQTTWSVAPPASTVSTADVSFRATVRSASPVKAEHVMVNVRDQADREFPVGIVRNATIRSSGLTLSGSRKFAPGTYRYRVGYMSGGQWHNVGDVRTFTVKAAATSITPTPATPTPAKPNPAQPASVDNRWVMGYYVGYLKDAYPLDSVEWTAMTHIAVGAAVPRHDGSLDTTFFHETEAEGRAWAKSVTDRAHRNGRRAILMLGGAGSRDAFAAAATPQRRSVLVANILRTTSELGFDGVDVDWEPMSAADGPNVLALGRELKAARPSIQLTIPIGTVNVNRPGETVFPFSRDLAGVYDQLNIMSYGMNGGWRDWRSWHNGALYGESQSTPMSIDSSVRAFVQAGVPAKKLGLGIGFYGSCMSGVTQPRQATSTMKVVADDNVMSYTNIMKNYHRPDRVRWDDVAKVPYLSSPTPFGPAGCTYVSYEDHRSVAEKAAYAKAKGLGGAIIWNINEGPVASSTSGRDAKASAPASLLSAVGSGFLK